ncbi:MAG TPA: PAS domain S-box protein [Chthoniobacteraceae bacterium]|jgi:PAS domain S-box-containing protein|nr:PAS domain S-box protein [Chthoniobacteraceae bacterium]
MLVLYFAMTGACLYWQHQVTLAGRLAGEDMRDATERTANTVRLGRSLVEMFAAGVEPDGNEARYQGARRQVTSEVAAIRGLIGSVPKQDRSEFAAELRAVEVATNGLREEMDIAFAAAVDDPDAPGTMRPPPDLRDRFTGAMSLLSTLRTHAERLQTESAERHRHSIGSHEELDIILTGLLLAFTGGICFYLYRMAARARAESREKAGLNDQLRATEAKYRAIFDHALEGIFQMTPDGRFLTANHALARMYGYQSPEHLMASLDDAPMQLYVEVGQREELLKALQEEGVVSNMETEVVRADGHAMWIRENVRAVKDDQGNLLYLEGTVVDISDRWWSEQRQKLQVATSHVLESTLSVAEARPKILQQICDLLEWDMGAVWDVNVGAGVLTCSEVWHTPSIDITEYQQAVSQMTLAPGEGLAGQVWTTGESWWNANLVEDRESPGSVIAVKNGMGSAFGVPIKVNNEVLHVVEFFSPKMVLPDPELLQMLGMIGTQLGNLVERKTAEEALRKSEMRKAAILHSALDCIISFDADGKIVEFNPAAERAFGYRQVDAMGRDVAELILTGQAEQFAPTDEHGTTLYTATNPARSVGRRVELVGMRSDGSEFPAEVAISRIKIDGKTMYTAYVRDISERKEAERVTSELAAVVANSNDAIIGCTSEGSIRSWNNGAERIYGYTKEEAIGRPLHMLIPPERLDEFPRTLAAIRKGESIANYETVRLRKDGKKIAVSLTDSPIRAENGRITGLSSIARDITERKRLEEELLQSQKMEAVGRLAGGIAHDFNNILTAILGYSDLLIGQIEERHWMYKHLTEIRKASDFAASLTQQLLAFSRRQPLYLRVFCINETVRNLHKMLQRVIGENIKITTKMTADIGRIKADPSQLEQVLLNLCVNARDAMPGGGSITIHTADITYIPDDKGLTVAEMPAGEYVRLSVLDTGTGIAPEIAKHIFEPFFTTKEKGHGTGLGLATCYGIVKQSGGYIGVESVLDEGTTFSIYLPRVDEAGEKANIRETGPLPGGNETILYVEDEMSVRSLTSHVLRRLGYTVLEACDAQEAQTIVEERADSEIDLLFSDVVLPDLSGRQLADWVCTRRQTKLLFTSGYVDEQILRRHGVEADAAFLQKPFTPSDLARKLREVIEAEV